MHYIYTTFDTLYVLNDKFAVVEEKKLSKHQQEEVAQYLMSGAEIDAIKKHKDVKFANKKEDEEVVYVTRDELAQILKIVSPVHAPREVYISQVAKRISQGVEWDELTIQAIKSIEEVDVTINMLAKRLREWFEWHNPEMSRSIDSHEGFAKAIVEGKDSPSIMGKEFSSEELAPIKHLAESITNLSEFKEETKKYIEIQLNEHLPNFTYLAGSQIGGKLLSEAKSARRLVKLPSSTIQVLGAEKALFRHLRTGSRPPKYGILFQHALVSKAPTKNKGKVARAIANALFIAIKKDYFSSDKDTKLAKVLEKRLGARK